MFLQNCAEDLTPSMSSRHRRATTDYAQEAKGSSFSLGEVIATFASAV